MTTVRDVLDAARQLSPVEQLEIIQSLSRSLQQRYTETTPDDASSAPRVLGLHAGKVWMSEDFDSELPDAFWLGDDHERAP